MIQVASIPEMKLFLDFLAARLEENPDEKWEYRDWKKVRIYSFNGKQIYGIADRGTWNTGYYLEPRWRKYLNYSRRKNNENHAK